MFRSAIRCGITVALLISSLQSTAPAQEFILPYLKSPETPQEFWAAVKNELDLGNHRRAGNMLRSFWEKASALEEKEQDRLLLGLYDQDGLSLFLKLSNIPEIRKVTAKDPAGKELPIADLLVSRINQLVGVRLGDPKRLDFFIASLSKSNEERAYALDQLRQAGPRAIPHMINVLRDDTREREHGEVYATLLKMNRDIGPPLLAALNSQKLVLRSLVISLFVQRADERIVPHLWYLHGLPDDTEVRRQATDALTQFLRTPVKKLGIPKAKLTEEAERYYEHQIKTPIAGQQTIWRWDEKAGLMAQSVTPSQWEEYHGVYWAKKALELDPAYRPAQVLLVSLLTEKAYERAGVEQQLSKTNPELNQLLASAGPPLLEGVLDRALAEGRTAVALGAARALAPAGDWRLIRSTDRGAPPLVRALSYPDRRVQLAAADAILRIPITDPFPGSSRVVDVLRRALRSDAAPKAVVGYADRNEGLRLGATLQKMGYEPVVVTTGREVVKLVLESADIELIFIDAALPDPGLAHLMSQLRTGPDTTAVPILLLAPKEKETAVQSYADRYARVTVLSPPPISVEMLKNQMEPLLKDAFRAPLTGNERKLHAQIALDWIGRIARREITGYDLRPAESAIHYALGNDALAKDAAEVLAHRPGRPAQTALAELAVNGTRAAPVRTEAAKQLRLHMQRHGILLKPDLLAKLLKLPAEVDDPILKEEAARLASGLETDAALAGNRLKQFEPPVAKPQPMPEGKE